MDDDQRTEPCQVENVSDSMNETSPNDGPSDSFVERDVLY